MGRRGEGSRGKEQGMGRAGMADKGSGGTEPGEEPKHTEMEGDEG